jgi:hypothetical protein
MFRFKRCHENTVVLSPQEHLELWHGLCARSTTDNHDWNTKSSSVKKTFANGHSRPVVDDHVIRINDTFRHERFPNEFDELGNSDVAFSASRLVKMQTQVTVYLRILRIKFDVEDTTYEQTFGGISITENGATRAGQRRKKSASEDSLHGLTAPSRTAATNRLTPSP